MCNFFSLFIHDPIIIEDIDTINKKMLINYAQCRKKEINYWNIKDPQYGNYLLTRPYNSCNKSYYGTLVKYANMIKNMKPYISKNDICLALLLAFYNISLYEHEEYIHHKRLLKIAQNSNYVKELYCEICGISIYSSHPDYWSDDERYIYEDINNASVFYRIFNDKPCENDVYKQIRKYMITGNGECNVII